MTFAENANPEHSACMDIMAQHDDTFILDEDENSPPVTDTGQGEHCH